MRHAKDYFEKAYENNRELIKELMNYCERVCDEQAAKGQVKAKIDFDTDVPSWVIRHIEDKLEYKGFNACYHPGGSNERDGLSISFNFMNSKIEENE